MSRRSIGRGKRRRGPKQTRRLGATPAKFLGIPEHELHTAPPQHEKRPSNRGPASGYDTPSKNAWRVAVWEHLAAFVPRSEREHARVFLIEGLEGLEIERATELGFADIHVCNNNPAVVATLKRRYPFITSYGVDAERAVLRMKRKGLSIDVASLDFCSCLSAAVLETVYAVRSNLSDVAAVGYNIMRGREQPPFQMDNSTGESLGSQAMRRMFGTAGILKRFRELSPNDRLRLIYMHAALLFGPTGFPPAEQIIGPKNPAHDTQRELDEGRATWQQRQRHPHRYDGVYFRTNEHGLSRKGHVRNFGIYPGQNNLTMTWGVSWSAYEIEGLEELDYTPGRGRTMPDQAPAAAAVPDRKTLGMRC